jgi:hypothetical protein
MPDDIKMSAAERSARANIPKSALDAMTAYDARGDLRAYGFARSPCGAIPTDHSKQQVARKAPGDGTGWRGDVPFGHTGQHPTPHVAQCDRLVDAQDARDKAAAQTQQGSDVMAVAMTAMATVLQTNQALMRQLIQANEPAEQAPRK